MRQAQKKVMVLGAGTIGVVIACLLSEHEDYEITLADHDDKALDVWSRGQANFHTVYLNVTDSDALRLCLSEYALDGVISALPFTVIVLSHALLMNCKSPISISQKMLQLRNISIRLVTSNRFHLYLNVAWLPALLAS